MKQCELTRLAVCRIGTLVNRYTNGSTVPDDIKAEAIILFCGYLADSPAIQSGGCSYSGALSTIPGRVLFFNRGAINGGGISAMPIREYSSTSVTQTRVIMRLPSDRTVAGRRGRSLDQPLGPVDLFPNRI